MLRNTCRNAFRCFGSIFSIKLFSRALQSLITAAVLISVIMAYRAAFSRRNNSDIIVSTNFDVLISNNSDVIIYENADISISNESEVIIDAAPVVQDSDILNDNNITMDDPRLINIVRKFLVPPSLNNYNFDYDQHMDQNVNPSAGQTQAVESILRGFGGDGFYLECGANDGEWASNTIWIERTLGWKGLMIEADPNAYAALIKKNRNAWSGHFCLSNFRYSKILPFYVDNTLRALGSGLIKSKKYYAEEPVNVQCFPLYTVLLAINRTVVDFFSLDVEGSELDILRTVPFEKVIFKVITIEHVVLKEGKKGLRKFMESKGYIFFRTVVDELFAAGDSIFIHKSVKLTKEQRARIGEEDSDLQRPVRA